MALFSAFTIGKDMSVTIEIKGLLNSAMQNSSTGLIQSIDLGLLEDFNAKPQHRVVTKTPINRGGVPVHRDTHGGWAIDMSFTRQDATGDYLEQALQDAYYTGGGSVLAKITHTIYSPLGAAYGSTVWVYDDAVFYMDDQGSFRAEEGVVQKYTAACPRRLPGASTGAQGVMEAFLAAQAAALANQPLR